MPKKKVVMSKETKAKAKATKAKNLKQVAGIEDQETDIVIDYRNRKLLIYTNRATIMNRIAKMGVEYIKEETVDGKVYSRSYVVPSVDLGKFLKVTLFKFD